MIVTVTGHRPKKVGGYSKEAHQRLINLAKFAIDTYTNASLVITGMALGWDQAVAQAAIEMEIPFLAAVPFSGQELKWPEASQLRYNELLEQADEVVIVCKGGYAPYKMQIRNQFMINRADLVLALWDGSEGGTCNAIRYAELQRKRIINTYKFLSLFKGE